MYIPAKTLTDAHIVCVAGLTGDQHPIHYADEDAKTICFGTRVAHGLLLTVLTTVGASTLSSVLERLWTRMAAAMVPSEVTAA